MKPLHAALTLQALWRARQARLHAASLRLALADQLAHIESRRRIVEEVTLAKKREVDAQKATLQLEAMKRDVVAQMKTSHVRAENDRAQIDARSIKGGRVFHFQQMSNRPALDLGDSRLALLPEKDVNDSQVELPVPEHQGCVVEIWRWLQSKHPVTGESCTGVLIPDTVVYKYRQPVAWFFTDRGGSARAKKGHHLSNDAIFETFARGRAATDICAV